MKVIVIDRNKVKILPTGGRIRDIATGTTYSEVYVKLNAVWRYEDADSVHYEEEPVDTLPEEVRLAFDQVVDLIVGIAMKYDALDNLRNLPAINIATLFGLAHEKGVTDADMQSLIMQVVMLKTDIEAKLPRSWYDVWNGNLKPYLLEKLAPTA